MDLKDFVETCVKLSLTEDNQYGLYPFQMVFEKNGKLNLAALCFGGDIASCYRLFKSRLDSDYVYMAVDFPKYGELEHDFIAVFYIRGNKIGIFGIPYNTETGEFYSEFYYKEHLSEIFEQFKLMIKAPNKVSTK